MTPEGTRGHQSQGCHQRGPLLTPLSPPPRYPRGPHEATLGSRPPRRPGLPLPDCEVSHAGCLPAADIFGKFQQKQFRSFQKNRTMGKGIVWALFFLLLLFFFNSAQSHRRVPTTSAPIPLQHRPCPHAVSPRGLQAPVPIPTSGLGAMGSLLRPLLLRGTGGGEDTAQTPPPAWGCSLGTQPGCGDMGTVALMPPGPAGSGLSVPSSPGRGGTGASTHEWGVSPVAPPPAPTINSLLPPGAKRSPAPTAAWGHFPIFYYFGGKKTTLSPSMEKKPKTLHFGEKHTAFHPKNPRDLISIWRRG